MYKWLGGSLGTVCQAKGTNYADSGIGRNMIFQAFEESILTRHVVYGVFEMRKGR